MGKSTILAIKIIGDATSAVNAMEKTSTGAQSMQRTMDGASVGAGIALAGLTAVASAAGDAASELEQATGAVDSVFGKYSDKVHQYASTAAEDVGLSAEAYSQMAAVLGSQLKNMGVDMDAVSGKSNDLIGVGADLAATFGGTTADAVNAVSSLLRGERDPIERYGVSLKQVDIDAKKAALGLDGLTGEADKAATTQATLALLTEQTASAHGQFAREADSAAGMQQRANAAWTDAQAALGEQLLPVMTESASIMADLAKWTGENSDLVTVLAIVIASLAAGILVINGAMKAYAAIQAIQTAAQWANNAAWLASPVTWIVLAVIAAIAILIAIVVLIVTHWDTIKAVGVAAWEAIVGGVRTAYEWLKNKIIGAVQGVIDFFNNLRDKVSSAFSVVINWIRDAYNWLMKLVGNAIPGWVRDLLGAGSFSARMVVEEPKQTSSARMLASSQETMSAFSFRSEPAPSAARSISPSISDIASLSRADTSATQVVHNEYKITIQGAIDPDGTARQIREVMTEASRKDGSIVAAGQPWR